jgi:conjugative transposon TraN protein
MKQVLFLLLLCQSCLAQSSLQLSSNKTTSLIFPFAIQHVDRGSTEILVQPVPSNTHVLLVKVLSAQFTPSNLSVLTSDGSVYSFTVQFAADPASLVIHVPPLQDAAIETYARALLDNAPFIKRVRQHHWGMQAAITGLYIKDEVLYCQVVLRNESPIDYTMEYLHLSIRDKRKLKRTAVQQTKLTPLAIAGHHQSVAAYSSTCFVLALDKFTIPDAKYFTLQFLEKNGGRHLQLNVTNETLLQAKLLPPMR